MECFVQLKEKNASHVHLWREINIILARAEIGVVCCLWKRQPLNKNTNSNFKGMNYQKTAFNLIESNFISILPGFM